MSTAEDTLTVNTNCTVGYSVYVSAINGGDTNLTNDSASASGNNTIAPSSAAVGGTSAVLSANTWGINGSSSEVEDGKYFGLPAYASATASALTTRSNVAEQITVPIYYGAKVTTAIAPGSYAGDVLYTVLPSSACTYYTIHYDANGGTGTMDNQTINVGENTALSGNTFTRSGYVFLGWSNTANGKTGTATNGIGTMADVDYTDKQRVTDISDFNTTKTLYAIWAVVSGDMQTWTGCSSLTTNAIVLLNDSRDNAVYAVKKLPDGKCWMIQNLTISATNLQVNSLNNTNTNVPNTDSNDYYLPPRNKRYNTANSITNSAVKTASGSVNFGSGSSNEPQIGYRTAGSTNNSNGNPVPENTAYYSYYTASLGFSYYQDGTTQGSSPRDICPKGWRLPWTSDAGTTRTTTADFYVLATSYNSGATWTNPLSQSMTNNPYTSDSTIRNNMISGYTNSIDRYGNNGAAGFTSGYYVFTELRSVGTSGFYWSSSVYDTNDSYRLIFNTTNVYPQSYIAKYYGNTVRCIAQNNYTVSYNANSGSGAASKASDSIYETGEITTANQGTLAKDGYNFLGWSLDQNATTATYSANTAISVPDLISAAGSPASSSTITLYAVWAIPDDGNLGTMQTFDCSSLTPGHTATVTDSRDNQTYSIYRWSSSGTAGTSYPSNMPGYCIMTKDLSLGYVTSGSITKGANLVLSTDTSADSTTSSAPVYARTSTSNWSTTNADSNLQYINGTGGTYDAHSYYSYGAAQKVCPKGWRPPTNTEWGYIRSFMGGSSSAGSTKIRGTPYNFVYGGEFFSYGWYSVGSGGSYWSSTQYSSTDGYLLRFYSSGLGADYYGKYTGFSVRCVASPKTLSDITYMQDVTPGILANTPSGTYSLKDSRDNQSYSVYTWPSTGTAGTDYPTGMAGYAIMTKDLSLGYVTGGSVTKGANLTLTTSDSAAAATITARTGTSDWSKSDGDSNKQYINGTGGTYDSHSYYSYGAAQAVCPKGWRLPTSAEYRYNITTFMGGDNSTGSSKIRGTPYNFVYGGNFYSSGWNGVGSHGSYWSSTQDSSDNGYNLRFNSSNLYPDIRLKTSGSSVRCVSSPSP